jgi:competence protein ComFC
MDILSFLFPKRCVLCKKIGSFLCPNCFSKLSFNAKSICLSCNKPSFNGLTHPSCKKKFTIDGCFSALTYNGVSRKLIYNFKYKPFLTGLKEVLSDLFYESLIQNEEFMQQIAPLRQPLRQGLEVQEGYEGQANGGWFMVPVPLSSAKLRKRGYNQAEILAKELEKNFSIPTLNLLKRIRDTKTQVGLKEEERRTNIKGVFAVKARSSNIEIRNILLVDDVVTTGSTLMEAARVLKKAGAKRVIGISLIQD